MTVVRKCNRKFVSWWGGVMVMGRSKRALGGASLDRKCDIHQGGVKGIKNQSVDGEVWWSWRRC